MATVYCNEIQEYRNYGKYPLNNVGRYRTMEGLTPTGAVYGTDMIYVGNLSVSGLFKYMPSTGTLIVGIDRLGGFSNTIDISAIVDMNMGDNLLQSKRTREIKIRATGDESNPDLRPPAYVGVLVPSGVNPSAPVMSAGFEYIY